MYCACGTACHPDGEYWHTYRPNLAQSAAADLHVDFNARDVRTAAGFVCKRLLAPRIHWSARISNRYSREGSGSRTFVQLAATLGSMAWAADCEGAYWATAVERPLSRVRRTSCEHRHSSQVTVDTAMDECEASRLTRPFNRVTTGAHVI
jgi:hypothetical protein